jgi:hypothetical protein
MGPSHWLGLLFLAYATASILWAPIWQQAVWDLWLTWILAFCFCLGAARYDPRLWIGMAVGLAFSDCIALSQSFGYQLIYENGDWNRAGNFVNPDMFGETATLVSVALIASRIYWPLVFSVPAICFAQSRTTYIAIACVIAFMAWERWRWAAIIPSVLALLIAGWFATSSRHDAIQERFALWEDTASGITPFGRGAGSFFMLYPEFAKRTDTMYTRPEDPHNEYLNLAFEYGIGALPIILLFSWAMVGGDRARWVCAAFACIALFSFPTRIPTEGFVGMVALGRLCRDRDWAWLIDLGRRPLGYARAGISRCKAITMEQVYPHPARI